MLIFVEVITTLQPVQNACLLVGSSPSEKAHILHTWKIQLFQTSPTLQRQVSVATQLYGSNDLTLRQLEAGGSSYVAGTDFRSK